MSRRAGRTILVDALARVEGEGALYIKLAGEHVADVRLRLYEPPRLFEALLRGRHFTPSPKPASQYRHAGPPSRHAGAHTDAPGAASGCMPGVAAAASG